jgi:hypothetical protein
MFQKWSNIWNFGVDSPFFPNFFSLIKGAPFFFKIGEDLDIDY